MLENISIFKSEKEISYCSDKIKLEENFEISNFETVKRSELKAITHHYVALLLENVSLVCRLR